MINLTTFLNTKVTFCNSGDLLVAAINSYYAEKDDAVKYHDALERRAAAQLEMELIDDQEDPRFANLRLAIAELDGRTNRESKAIIEKLELKAGISPDGRAELDQFLAEVTIDKMTADLAIAAIRLFERGIKLDRQIEDTTRQISAVSNDIESSTGDYETLCDCKKIRRDLLDEYRQLVDEAGHVWADYTKEVERLSIETRGYVESPDA